MAKVKTTKFGQDLIQAMGEALAHAQGKEVPGLKLHRVDVKSVNVKNIRKKLKLTQDEMASSRIVIAEQLGVEPRHFAYPVGDPTSAGLREFAMARALGFASALTTRPGMLFPGHAGHLTALPRVSVNGNWQDIGFIEVLLSGAPFALWNRGRRINAA